jgi:ParB-like chromosome segregation protein Spo0J
MSAPKPHTQRVAAVWVPLDSLVPWSENPRQEQPVEAVAESIRVYGFGRPIVARQTNREIIAGHTSWKAAKLVGLTEVPVRFLDVDERTAHQLAVADNALGEHAKWDAVRRQRILDDATMREVRAMGVDAKTLLTDRAKTRKQLDVSRLRYQIVIDVDSEQEQAETLDRLEAEGLKCRALIL